MNLAAESIRNYILFAGVVVHLKIVILNELQPPPLKHIQISLGKDIFDTFMICVDVAMGSH
jgi:hypothetical protein